MDEQIQVVLAVLKGDLSLAGAGRGMGCPRRRWGSWRDRFADAGQAGISVWPLADPLFDREVPT